LREHGLVSGFQKHAPLANGRLEHLGLIPSTENGVFNDPVRLVRFGRSNRFGFLPIDPLRIVRSKRG